MNNTKRTLALAVGIGLATTSPASACQYYEKREVYSGGQKRIEFVAKGQTRINIPVIGHPDWECHDDKVTCDDAKQHCDEDAGVRLIFKGLEISDTCKCDDNIPGLDPTPTPTPTPTPPGNGSGSRPAPPAPPESRPGGSASQPSNNMLKYIEQLQKAFEQRVGMLEQVPVVLAANPSAIPEAEAILRRDLTLLQDEIGLAEAEIRKLSGNVLE